jgi:para-aminobenzoate synthetase component 1
MADPIAVVRSKGTRTEIVGFPDATVRVVAGDVLGALREQLAPWAADPMPQMPPFQGGAAGYLAYDWGHVLESVPVARSDDFCLPDVVLDVYDWVFIHLDRARARHAAAVMRRASGDHTRDGGRSRRFACYARSGARLRLD